MLLVWMISTFSACAHSPTIKAAVGKSLGFTLRILIMGISKYLCWKFKRVSARIHLSGQEETGERVRRAREPTLIIPGCGGHSLTLPVDSQGLLLVNTAGNKIQHSQRNTRCVRATLRALWKRRRPTACCWKTPSANTQFSGSCVKTHSPVTWRE